MQSLSRTRPAQATSHLSTSTRSRSAPVILGAAAILLVLATALVGQGVPMVAALFAVSAAQPIPGLHAQAPSVAGYATPALTARPATDGPTDAAEIKRFLDPLVTQQLDSRQIPGAQVAVVRDGQVLFARGYGYADIEQRIPARADSIFRSGSIAKLFTWTAVMQLVEEGKLDLNADVNSYLTAFTIPPTYSQPITLAHLLTHTAGFEDRTSNGALYAADAAHLEPLGAALAQNLPARIFPPGSRVAYSNYGAALAGHLVERASGLTFEQYVATNILRTLDMRRTTFAQPLPTDLASPAAVGYAVDDEGAPSAREFEYLQLSPAGALSTTALDMGNFMIAHLQEGRFGDARILRQTTAQDMHMRHFASDSRLPGIAWGFVEANRNGLRLLMHRGSTDLVHGNLVLVPDAHVGIYLAFNSPAAGRASGALMNAFIDHYYPLSNQPPIVPPLDFESRAASFTGTYQSTQRSATTLDNLGAALAQRDVVNNGDNTLSLTGAMDADGRPKRWAEIAPLVFQEVGGQSLLAFGEDDAHRITTLFDGDQPIVAYERLPWYAVHMTQLIATIAALALFLIVVAAWIIEALIGVLRRKRTGSRWMERWARPLAAGVLLLDAAVAAGVMVTLTGDLSAFNTQIPMPLRLSLGLGLLSAVATAGVVLCAMQAWRTRAWSFVGRLEFTVVALSAVVFIGYLNSVNLLGFRV